MKLFDKFGKKDPESPHVAALLHEENAPDEVVFGIYDRILERSAYGDRPSKLTPEERVILVVRLVEDEVNNGGFSQFVFNTAGNFVGETVAAMTAIGAHATAAICQRAWEAFGTDIPVNRRARQALLESKEAEGIGEILNECDDAFYAYEDDLVQLCYAYIMAHKEAFC
jgi:hypothetical protein